MTKAAENDAYDALQDEAQRALNEGRVAEAIAGFDTLRQIPSFPSHYYCWLQYGVALARAGEYQKAETELGKLVNDKEIQKPERAVFRAVCQRVQAEVLIVRGHSDQALSMLEQAEMVFEANFAHDQQAVVLRIKSMLTASKDPIAAIAKRERSREMAETYRAPATLAGTIDRIGATSVIGTTA